MANPNHYSPPNMDYENYNYLETLKTGVRTPNATAGSGFDYMSLAPLASTLINQIGFGEDLKRENEALMNNMDSAGISHQHSQYQKALQLESLSAVVGDKLSESGFESMVREADLKAGSAETGATGSSMQENVLNAEVQRLHRDSTIIADYKTQQSSALMSVVADRLNFENELTSMRSGQRSGLSAMLESMNVGFQGMNTGLGFLNQSQQENFFGTNTTGKRSS